MKRLLIMLLLPALFLSCSKDSDSNNEVSSIVGEWVDADGKEYPTLSLKSNNVYTLKANSNTNSEGMASGNYSYENDKLTLKWNYGNFVYKLTWKGDNQISLFGGIEGTAPREQNYKRK